jgi:polar amino acid transport system substrate-binding protein
VSTVSSDVAKELAPTGKLRAAINLGNPVLAQGTPADPRGVTVDLARELARRTSLSLELVPFSAAGKVFEALQRDAWDVAFLAIRQAMGTPRERAAAAVYLRAFVEEMKVSGFVADALQRSNQPDAAVAPAE